jgi:hypothetical protein
MPKLHDVLKAGYQGKTKIGNFVRDNDLSDGNQQVFFNKKKNKLIVNVNGTHNISDIGSDIALGLGGLKTTNRYKDAKNTYEAAKQKYTGAKTTVSGHSLGGAIAGNIARGEDKVLTLDPGFTVGQKARANVTNYRTSGDVVSLLAPSKNTITLQNDNTKTGIIPIDFLNAHNVSNVAKNNIRL